VVSTASGEIDSPLAVSHLAPEQVVEFVRSHDDATEDALVVPDTALRTMPLLAALRSAVSRPVLTANQVSGWAALRLAGEESLASELLARTVDGPVAAR
jgi:maleate cis-trans isomerase